MALVTNPPGPPETYVQVGVAASALKVLQMPPPAAAAQTRQNPALQPLNESIASAVIRPDTLCVEPVKVKIFGSFAMNEVPSPTCCHIASCGGSNGPGRSSPAVTTGGGV